MTKDERSELIQILANYHVATSEIDIRDDAALYITFYQRFSKYDDTLLRQLLLRVSPNHPLVKTNLVN